MPEKTVYILGAGASKTASLPTQAGILDLIFSIRFLEVKDASEGDDFLSLKIDEKIEKIKAVYPLFDKDRQDVGAFIVANFSSKDKINEYTTAIEYANNLQETDAAAVNQREAFLFRAYDIAKSVSVSLEDLFTIFDNVAAGREHFRLYSPDNMVRIHNQIKLCVIYALVFAIANSCDDTQYKRFSKLLLLKRLAASQKDDVVSVITMNWDDVLEKTLFNTCKKYNARVSKKQQRAFLDLCFYDYSLGMEPDHIPSTHIKAKGNRNIKILKMHGSLGWLECPKCGRIFTDFSREIAVEEYSGVNCPYCKTTGYLIGEDPILRSLIITPTFIKSLENLNVKNIWHNACIDVSEASHLIFIGYSFPDADFEMRCLLKKAVRNDADILVVLNDSNDPQKYMEHLQSKGFGADEAKKYVDKMWLPEARYKSFFGEDKVKFDYSGFQGYLSKIGGLDDEEKTDEQ